MKVKLGDFNHVPVTKATQASKVKYRFKVLDVDEENCEGCAGTTRPVFSSVRTWERCSVSRRWARTTMKGKGSGSSLGVGDVVVEPGRRRVVLARGARDASPPC